MDKYKPKKGKIFRGIILLFLFFFVMWFIAEGFIIYTSFADNYAYRSISGYYVDGRVTRLLKIPEEHGGKVDKIEAEYRILNKVYVYASFVRSENVRKRLRAVCSYQNHIFKSKWYKAENIRLRAAGK